MALASGRGIKRLRSMDVLGWVNYVSPEDPPEEHVPWQPRDTCPMAIRNARVRGTRITKKFRGGSLKARTIRGGWARARLCISVGRIRLHR